ncbi:hypothetical protein [Spongiactinospora sp. TRM90649]|uniref:hypothetical protein n=1 Tax=Spongiactinospora sp. TRM90649 TaxID=3031114 RepID=UPI0023F61D5B|nr:hypothetical protein [Spongiactinospora sp. TRM90649]MDF5757780.1 hypothetical protein [Spongiactinospora sp. TRM90649]
MLKKRRVRRAVLMAVMVCLLAVADTIGPLQYYVGRGIRVGYPAGWEMRVSPDLSYPLVMAVEPPTWPYGWWAEYRVFLFPYGVTLEEAAGEYFESIASEYALLESEKVVVGTGMPGYLVRTSYVSYTTDMQGFSSGDFVLFTVTKRGQVLVVRCACVPERCLLEAASIRSMLKSMVSA